MNQKCSTPHTPARLRASSSARTLCALTLIALACAAAQAQEEGAAKRQSPEDSAPPPIRYVPDEVRARLAAARDDKERTRLSIALADERLARRRTRPKAAPCSPASRRAVRTSLRRAGRWKS